MMKPLDLDVLKQRWQARDSAVASALKLEQQPLQHLLAGRTRSAFRRHSRWLLLTLCLSSLLLLGLLAFMASVHDPLYQLAAAPLLLLSGWSWLQGMDEARRWRRLDLSAPVLQVRAELDLLRRRRLRLGRWILFSSFLLWLPLLAVLLRALGGDLLRQLPPSVLWANLGLGLLVLLLGPLLARRVDRRYRHSRVFQRLLDDSAGGSLSAVRQRFEAQQRAEPAQAALEPALRRLQHALFWRICAHALLMLLNSAYLIRHGGAASGLWPGIVLQLLLVGLMVGAIVQRRLLVRVLADGDSGSADSSTLLQELLAMRTSLTRAAGVASPLALVVVVQVLLHACGWIGSALLQPLGLGLLGLALLAMLLLWSCRAHPAVLRIGDLLGLQALRATRRALQAINRATARSGAA